ncbi:putative acyl-CoA dehydrogenase [Mesorhizobium sp. SOD10]|nr:putative acyl-CoA dehydrogenase [Mesorhizobium sp. SOD10]
MNDVSRMLAQTASRILAQFGKRCREQLQSAELFAEVHKSGLNLALLPEDAGGAGLTIEEAAEILRIWGRHAATLPMVEMLVAAPVAVMFGHNPATSSITARSDIILSKHKGQACLSGRPIEAPLSPGCRQVYARATDLSGNCFILSVSTANSQTFADLAGEPWVRLAPEDALDVRALSVGRAQSEKIARSGALLTAAAMTGAMGEILELAIDHVNTRSQFGRPLGRFQAIQHLLSDVASELAVTEAVLGQALQNVHDRLGWLSAKAQAGRGATIAASTGHQLFGAIGFTAEHLLHCYTKRLWVWRDHWGRQDDCERTIGEMAMRSGEGRLWSFLVDGSQGDVPHV